MSRHPLRPPQRLFQLQQLLLLQLLLLLQQLLLLLPQLLQVCLVLGWYWSVWARLCEGNDCMLRKDGRSAE